MPRKPRIISSTGIYHTILRSVNQHIIFEEDYDYQKFLYILSDCKKKFGIDIYAYCLMDNHIHLLIHALPAQLPSFFQSLGTIFVRWYNSKYERSGHLFQDRYHSIAVESEDGFLTALTYIHLNPVKANVCRFASEYRWSSFNAYYGAKNPLVNVSFAYGIAGSKDSLLHYFAFQNTEAKSDSFKDVHREATHYITDENAMTVFKDVTRLKSTSEAARLPKVQRNDYVRLLREKKLTVRQIGRLMDISPSTVKRICGENTIAQKRIGC